jgi:hypothetical protein
MVAVACLGGATLAWGAGCTRRGLPGTVPVEGRVTFDGGTCPAVGSIVFLPAADQPTTSPTPRAGWARFERDGRYRATTLVHGDGLLPGVYEVRVDCRATSEAPAGHHEMGGTSIVPASMSLPRLTIPQGGRGPLRHDIDVGGPAAAAADAPGAGGDSRVHDE